MIISLIIGFLIGAAAIVFVLQNTAIIAVTFFGWQFQSSLALILFVVLAVGVLITLLLSLPGAIRSSLQLGKLRKENKRLTDEVAINQHAVTEVNARMKLLEEQLGAATGHVVEHPRA